MDRYRGPRRSPGPRDRPARERDDHPDVHYLGTGESYRPGGAGGDISYRPGPRDRDRGDSWSANDRRDGRRDERREDIDSYVPPTSARAAIRPRSRSPPPLRRRSRTPPNRREDLFADRRSPPRRYSPPRRSPPRRRSRSPPYGRPRSPPDFKRSRDYSPDAGRRSPKRERRFSPERRFDSRDRSPPRDPGRGGESYRPRSRSPPRRRPNDNWSRRSPSPRDTGPASHDTSRRSSPPIHPDRLSLAGSQTRSPAPPLSRHSYDRVESASYRDRSPPAGPARRDDRPPDRDVSMSREDGHMNGTDTPRQPPSGPSSYRNGSYDRPPPTGPLRSFSQSQQSPPTGPAASSVSAHSRGGGAVGRPTPTGPRSSAGRYDAPPPRDFASPPMRGRGLPFRGPSPYTSRGGGYGRGDYAAASATRGEFSSSTSYRGGGYGRGAGGGTANGGEQSFAFRGNSSSSTTYPRTQRFNPVQQHLATTEKLVPGGKLLPSGLPPDQEKRIKNLEVEAERIRVEIAEKQKVKREVLNEWEVRERESARDALRTELAEQHLQQLMDGDDGMGRAAF